jgi:uncharacterized membrane protein HdeD (DUF308 family)
LPYGKFKIVPLQGSSFARIFKQWKIYPSYISLFFVLVTLLTVILFYHAANKSRAIMVVVIAWLALQGIVGLAGFLCERQNNATKVSIIGSPATVDHHYFICHKKRKGFD